MLLTIIIVLAVSFIWYTAYSIGYAVGKEYSEEKHWWREYTLESRISCITRQKNKIRSSVDECAQEIAKAILMGIKHQGKNDAVSDTTDTK